MGVAAGFPGQIWYSGARSGRHGGKRAKKAVSMDYYDKCTMNICFKKKSLSKHIFHFSYVNTKEWN